MKNSTYLPNKHLIESVQKVAINPANPEIIIQFVKQLKEKGFKGNILSNAGDCSAYAADNSIYWLSPQLVLQPKSIDQIGLILSLANQDCYQDLCFTSRGGSTSTNAQSLNYSVMIDTLKYLNKILDHNLQDDSVQEKWIEVQAGISAIEVDQFAAKFGYQLATQISTQNRATIGGMIATNAAGRGSLIYGNIGNQLIKVSTYLFNGSQFEFTKKSYEQVKKHIQYERLIHPIYNYLSVNRKWIAAIAKQSYPNLIRAFTGYNLPYIYQKDHINFNQLIAGSEGTLAIITSAKIKLIAKAKFKTLIVVKYANFDDALDHAQNLIPYQAHSIETMDEAIQKASTKLSLWKEVEDLLSFNGQIAITNFIGLEADNSASLKEQTKQISQQIKTDGYAFEIVENKDLITKLYQLREQSAAVFSAVDPNKRSSKIPIPFIEDCVISLKNLKAFMNDFRAILAEYDLHYGVFGHVDVGVLHLRPALDLRQAKDRKLIRIITERLIELLKIHQGLLWGEHGKGVRGEFSEDLLGSKVSKVATQIKQIFDPNEKLNPHKIAGAKKQLYKVDSLAYKVNMLNFPDINSGIWFNALSCNGNGLCNSLEKSQTMCPSFKTTRDIRYSPKGRANMLRSYLISKEIYSSRKSQKFGIDFELDLKKSLDYCLNCKACQSQCPISVDIGEMTSQFYYQYYQNHPRPLADSLIKRLEKSTYFYLNYPKLTNLLLHNQLAKKLFKKMGLVNLPKIKVRDQKSIQLFKNKLQTSAQVLKAIEKSQDKNPLILIFDLLTNPFDSQTFLSTITIIEKLGYQVYCVNDIKSAKALKVRGMLKQFNIEALASSKKLADFYQKGIPVVIIDSAVGLCLQKEYPNQYKFKVELIADFLAKKINLLDKTKLKPLNKKYKIMLHCSEQTSATQIQQNWQKIFTFLDFDFEIINAGCCGMAGLFGHQKNSAALAKQIFKDNWQEQINQQNNQQQILVTGASCRSQVNLINQLDLIHPLTLIARSLV